MKFLPKEAIIALAAAAAGTGGAMLLYRMTFSQAAPYGITIVVFWIIYSSRKNYEIDAKDERIRKLSLVSMSYTWFLTLFALIGIYWIDYFGVVSLTIGNVVFLILLVMTISPWVLRLVLSRKGDFE
jgi:hypothetical protein